MLDALLRRLAVAFHARVAATEQVRADDEPSALSGGEAPLRVLLTGSGITTGWGVQTYGLALVGSLQRALQLRLDRPVDVVQVGGFGVPMADAPQVLGRSASEPWDAVVVAFGLSDAFLLTSVQEWTRGLERLLAKLDGDMPSGRLVPIVVVGIPPMESLRAARPFACLLQRHAERLNAASRAVVEGNRRAVFAALPDLADREIRPDGSPTAYREWAEAIVDVAVPTLLAAGAPRIREARVEPPVGAVRSTAEPTRPARRMPLPLRARRRELRVAGSDLARTGQGRPVPLDGVLRLPGADPIRVLTIGGDYSIGFGAVRRADAVDGALARLLHTRTGRGVEVENRSRAGVRLEQLAGSLGPTGARDFDLVLWTPAFVEAATVLVRSRWTTGLHRMLGRIESSSDAAVLLVGLPALAGSQPLAVIGRARAQQLNRLLRRVAGGHERTAVVEPPAVVLHDVATADAQALYLDVAVELLPAALRLLRPGRGGLDGRASTPLPALVSA